MLIVDWEEQDRECFNVGRMEYRSQVKGERERAIPHRSHTGRKFFCAGNLWDGGCGILRSATLEGEEGKKKGRNDGIWEWWMKDISLTEFAKFTGK